MAIEFRLLRDGSMVFFGVRCPREEERRAIEVLRGFPEVGIAAAMCGVLAGRRNPALEQYWAGNKGWPQDFLDFGVHRFRCLLLGAGFGELALP